jgi:hemophore-related protein
LIKTTIRKESSSVVGSGVGGMDGMLSKTKLVVASGGLALSMITGAGIASASPDVSPIVNSTCTYPQVMAALNAENPDAANQVTSNPIANAWLQQLVASPPSGRQAMVQQAQGVPALQQYTGLIYQVANTCNNY